MEEIHVIIYEILRNLLLAKIRIKKKRDSAVIVLMISEKTQSPITSNMTKEHIALFNTFFIRHPLVGNR